MNVLLVQDDQGLDRLVDFLERQSKLPDTATGLDVETTPLRDFYFRRCRTIQFGAREEQYVIDLLAFCDGDPDLLQAVQGNYGANLHRAPRLRSLLDRLRPYLTEKKLLLVGVNLGFEYMTFYWLFGIRIFHLFDCSMVERVIVAGHHSLKDYAYFSMHSMAERYLQADIDKKYQESFTLDAVLIEDQITYAALDTRVPLALRAVQMLILQGKTYAGLKAANSPAARYLQHIDPLVTGDNLMEIAQIENDAIPFFEDMHVHGERLDRERWLSRVAGKKTELAALIQNVLDPIFLPIVGSKTTIITQEEIDAAAAKWKSYNNPTDEEVRIKAAIRFAKKTYHPDWSRLESQQQVLEEARKAEKEVWKTKASELGKTRTKVRNLIADCEGQALINYGSDAQLLKVIVGMRGLGKVTNLDDEALEKYEEKGFAVMGAIRKYHGLSKEIGTYGDAWAQQWATKPCKDEGWLHPGDGRLHCVFNQYDAETGRSSSEKPNGQNLPQDKEVRNCFIADAPDENVRISDCCDAEIEFIPCEDCHPDHECGHCRCVKCNESCETHAEDFVLITCDMSGAELRIIAELAQDPIWIGAFERGEDVHSVGTEILYEEEWPKLALPDCAYYKLHTEATVAENPKCVVGQPMRRKCKCPEHGELRNATKAVNFLLAYGGGPSKLAQSIRKTVEQAKALMAIHEHKFPRIWKYLEESGRRAKASKKSFDMYGRRRIFPEATNDRARAKMIADYSDKLKLDSAEAEHNIATWKALHADLTPKGDDLWSLTHRMPNQKEITKTYMGMCEGIGRQGKNHEFQGTNATIAKLSAGAGIDANGKPYLWHLLPQYKARFIKFVHDELVLSCPRRFAEKVAAEIQDAFRRAASVKMKRVVMESEYNVDVVWSK